MDLLVLQCWTFAMSQNASEGVRGPVFYAVVLIVVAVAGAVVFKVMKTSPGDPPQVDKPEGDVPFELGIDDLAVGEGEEATKGRVVDQFSGCCP